MRLALPGRRPLDEAQRAAQEAARRRRTRKRAASTLVVSVIGLLAWLVGLQLAVPFLLDGTVATVCRGSALGLASLGVLGGGGALLALLASVLALLSLLRRRPPVVLALGALALSAGLAVAVAVVAATSAVGCVDAVTG